jgi:LuxR family maltose regulon positive regulatory protein
MKAEDSMSGQHRLMTVPRPTGSRVQRPGLLRRLESAREPLVLLVAPSGFGKTSLLAQWATTTDTQVAWLSCDESFQEPAQFWSRLTASLAGRWPGVGSDAARIVERPAWSELELADSLASDLADLPARAAVVIDDAQFAEPAQRTLVSVAQRLPAHVCLLVASQHNPPFSTSRLRLAGVITELRADDLAFTQVEVDQLIELAGLGRESIDGSRLLTLTEGWPAGLQMAVLAMRAGGDPGEVINALASTTQEASDYLASEVLNRLPPDLAGFLTNICVLEQFDAQLCQAVSGAEDAGRLLDRVIADDLFIYQVDPAGEQFRLHPMFAAFLRARLKSLGRTQFREAHLRAAGALQQRGDRLGALHHAIAAGDMQLAADGLVDSMRTILDVTHAQEAAMVARAWLARFGDAAAESSPGQLLPFVLLLAASGHPEAESWLRKVGDAHPRPAPHLDAFAQCVWAAYYLNRGSTDRALEHNKLARQALSAAAGNAPLFPMLAELPVQEAAAHLLAGDLAAAASALQHGTAPLSAPIVDEFRSPVAQAWVAFLQGDLVWAAAALDRAVRGASAEHDAVAHGVGLIIAHMAEAGMHLERREHEPAAALLATARAAVRINGRRVLQAMVDTWIARLATAQGDRAGALASLAQARLAFMAPDDKVRAQFAIEEFRIALALEPAEAGVLVPQLPATTASQLLEARLHVARREWAKAEEILKVAEPATIREHVESGVLRSLAAQASDLTLAHGYLQTALSLAMPHRYVATIIEQGAGIAALLHSLPATTNLKPYVDELSIRAEAAASSSGPAGLPPGGLLSDRELTVLRLLSSRLTSNEIAGALFVSSNTLKSHVKSIYRKLGVNSRADAVRDGQARGLI